jgi:hypothetical protein
MEHMGRPFPDPVSHPGGLEGWAAAVAAACGDSALNFQVFTAAAGTPAAQRRPESAPVSMSFATVLGGRNTRSMGTNKKLCLKLSDLSATSPELAKKPINQTAVAELLESAVGSLADILPGADYLLVRLSLPNGENCETEVCSRGNRRFGAVCGCCVHPSCILRHADRGSGFLRLQETLLPKGRYNNLNRLNSPLRKEDKPDLGPMWYISHQPRSVHSEVIPTCTFLHEDEGTAVNMMLEGTGKAS